MAQIWRKGEGGNPDRYVCSGVVTDRHHLLSANHCFEPHIGIEYYALSGSTVLGEGKRSTIIWKAAMGDLAALTTEQTDGPLDTKGAPYAQLGPNKKVPLRKELESHGWGKTCANCGPSTKLKGVFTKVNDNDDSLRARGGAAYRVRVTMPLSRIRAGDSGGPSGYFPTYGGVRVVTGVASKRVLEGADAYMAATYDQKGCDSGGGAPPCVHDWLQRAAKMKVYDDNHDELLAQRDITVMPLGDSITEGFKSSHGAGYRSRLGSRLDAATRDLDFTGSQHSGQVADPDHEGYSGQLIDFVAGKAKTAVPLFHPSVVTLHVGTNDVDRGIDLQSAPTRLGRLIDQILRDSPDTTVLVATLVPSKGAATQDRIDDYNDGVVDQVRLRAQAGKHVALVDMSDVTADDLADNLHPNDRGYDKMADAWYRGISAATAAGWVKDAWDGGVCTTRPGRWIDRGQIASGVGATRTNVRFADFNGDGRDDYLTVDPTTGAVHAWINTGGDSNGKPGWSDQGQVASGTNPTEDETVEFADIDGDGRDDYLLVDNDGSVRAWINKGGDSNGRPGWIDRGQIAAGVGSTGVDLRFADFDGDGRDDYLVVHPRTGAVHAWINNGGDSNGRPGWIDRGQVASGTGNGTDVIFGDVNCDRRADYLVRNPLNGAVHAWLNAGGDTGGSSGWIDRGRIAAGTGGDPDGLRFADVDGDGLDDYLLVHAETGAVHAWINRGGDPA
ncbi:FG-GAP-like repeat-containing protein [Streptomyces sp. NPDC005322]|uniref:FG-GAP-like repeat-containing protein n=1 Tax=Streptomyces sp. NPDC005322 TaxID=3157032 RepID=UPI0033AF7568